MGNEMLHGVTNAQTLAEGSAGTSKGSQPSLGQAFEKLFAETGTALQQADETVLEANTGGDVDVHEMMIAMEKADMSLRLLVQVRNKTVDAYKEIMRMQV